MTQAIIQKFRRWGSKTK